MPGALSPDEASVGVLWLATLSVDTRQPYGESQRQEIVMNRIQNLRRRAGVLAGLAGIRAGPGSQSRARHDLQTGARPDESLASPP